MLTYYFSVLLFKTLNGVIGNQLSSSVFRLHDIWVGLWLNLRNNYSSCLDLVALLLLLLPSWLILNGLDFLLLPYFPV